MPFLASSSVLCIVFNQSNMENNNIEDRLERIESLLLRQQNVLSFDQASEHTGLSKSYLYKLTSSGGIPCYKPNGKHIYFNRVELDNWLLRNRKATSEEIEEEAINRITLR
ncbi:helix-turn-helix domain-containing protein [Bacteroidia bacterium]|nr:helix-turn-helix domain-containing protein [Bacteroidia bacterium]